MYLVDHCQFAILLQNTHYVEMSPEVLFKKRGKGAGAGMTTLKEPLTQETKQFG
jgi:hypothetical protein